MKSKFYPCRCLWRAFLQITRTTFLRFTMRQLSQRRLTEARTFIGFKKMVDFEDEKSLWELAVLQCDAGLDGYFCRKVIRPLVKS